MNTVAACPARPRPTSLLVVLVAALGLVVCAAEPDPSRSYSVRQWQTDDGLPHNAVQAITQTADGYLWVGTQDGLARFDGLRFTAYNATNAPELPKHPNITALCETPDGALWIGTSGTGLYRRAGGRFTRFTVTNGLPSGVIHCLLPARDGTLWAGTSQGACWWQGERFQTFAPEAGAPRLPVRTMAEDRERRLYFGTERGVLLLREGRIERMDDPKAYLLSLRVMLADRAGVLWCGPNRTLVRVDPRHPASATAILGGSHSFVSALLEDRAGNLWAGTYGGLNLLHRTNETLLEIRHGGEPFDLVNALHEDREGNLWVGDKSGLSRLRPTQFVTYTRPQGLSHNNVTSLLEDRDGTLWIGTWGGGLCCLSNGVLAAFEPSRFPDYLITALAQDRDGELRFGADNTGGFHSLSRPDFYYSPKQGYREGAARALCQDHTGLFWIGTRNGLCRFDGQAFTRFTTNDGLAGNIVRDLLEDRAHRLWIATQSGLSLRQGHGFTNFFKKDGLPHSLATCIYQDAAGAVWFGNVGGLARFQDGRFTAVTARQGLGDAEILDMLEDDYGRFWMSTPSGVLSVDKASLDAAAADPARRVQGVIYGHDDGLATARCNGYAQPAAVKTRDGRLWFATVKGLAVMDPRQARQVNDVPPPVILEEVLADRKPVAWLDQPAAVRIPPGRGELEFRYTALSLQNPEKNRFRYRLEGVDADWVEAGPRRAAYYTRIPPGHYGFRVTACNNDGVWNDKGALLLLTVQPHLWQTWWFLTAVILAAGFALIGAVRYLSVRKLRREVARLEQQHAIEQERTRIARDVHDDLGAQLTEILLLNELASQSRAQPAVLARHLDKQCHAAREMGRRLDEIIWAVNPKNDNLERLAYYLCEQVEMLLAARSIRCRLEVPDQLPDRPMASDVRHHVFLVVREALNNILKYAAATEVRFRLALEADTLVLGLEDNGKGFDRQAVSSLGNGLQNMEQRAREAGGQFALETQPGRGTRITLRVPLPPLTESKKGN